MEDKILIKLCILSAIIGLVLLIIISDKIELPSSNISSLTKQDINKAIKIRGTITQSTNKGTVSTIFLQDKTGSIEAVLFKPSNLILKKGSFIEIEGKVSLYNEKLQITAERVKILN